MQIIEPTDARRRQAVPRVDGLLPAFIRHAHVDPARELVLGVPLGLAVSRKTSTAPLRRHLARRSKCRLFFIFQGWPRPV